MQLDLLRKSLIAHEGSKSRLYHDTEGNLTGGVGHNFSQPLPQILIDSILDFDIKTAINELDRVFPIWRSLSSPRQNVVIELMFNMGAPKLSEFRNFWVAVGQKDYDQASAELLNSKWAKQVGKRAETLAKRFKEDLTA